MKTLLAASLAGLGGGAVAAFLVRGAPLAPTTDAVLATDDAERLVARLGALEAQVLGLKQELDERPGTLAPVEAPVARDVATLTARLEALEIALSERAARDGEARSGEAQSRAAWGAAPEAADPAADVTADTAPRRSSAEVILDPAASDSAKLEAHRTLRRVENAYTPAMIDALVDLGRASGDPSIRASTWTMFDGATHLPELVPDLMDAALHDTHAEPRREAAETLGNYIDDPAVRELLEQLAKDDPSKEVRDRAKRTLHQDECGVPDDGGPWEAVVAGTGRLDYLPSTPRAARLRFPRGIPSSKPARPMTPPPAVPDDANPYAAPKARVRVPEQSDSERPLASRFSRFVAFFIDMLLVGLLVFPLTLVFDIPLTEDGEIDLSNGMPTGVVVLYGLSGLYGLLQLVLLWIRSQTLGKIVMGIRVDDMKSDRRAGPVKAVLLRGVLFGIIVLIPILGALIALLNPLFIFGKSRRCLHDYVAGTVVREAP